MNQMARKKTLLVIDDSTAFCERVRNEGEERGWTVLATANLDEIRHWLNDHRPNVVLFDWQLPNRQRDDYVEVLKAAGLAAQTLLLSGTFDEQRRQFITKHGLAGVRLKPLDMGHFEEAISLPTPQQSSPAVAKEALDLEAVVNDLPLAANILDKDLTPIWSNARATEAALTSEHRLIASWLKAEMDDNKLKAARRIDWDGAKKVFLESRLYQLSNLNYWLARDWRSKDERPHDHELLNLDDKIDRTTWLQAVAKLLAQRYAISRFRVYKVARLLHSASYESELSPLMIPLFQSGGGFASTVESWRGTGFLASENVNTYAVFKGRYKPTPELVTDSSPRAGCGPIKYGTSGTRRIQFPVKDEHGNIVALFALDRRLDHSGEITDAFDSEVVKIANRMANDAIELTDEQWSLMRGLIEDIGRRLRKWLDDGEERRLHTWHERISTTLRDTFANAERSPEMTYDGLSEVCRRLAAEWEDDKIIGRIRGTSPWREGQQQTASISSWHIILETKDGGWQAVAGWGNEYDDCRQCGTRRMQEPHRNALSAESWKAVVIQDYKKWSGVAADLCRCEHGSRCRDIRSWLAVPMKVGQNEHALMVVHSPHAYYFTDFRSRLMEHAAKRMLPLLAAALREVRARTTFAVAVMHEVKSDAHAALLVLDDMQQGLAAPEYSSKPLAEVRHHLEGLELLGQDTLDMFRVGLGAHDLGRQPDDKDTTVILKDIFDRAIFGWNILYEDTAIRLDIPEEVATQRVSIRRPLAFKRVLRVLLHNAFRHGRDWVAVRVALGNKEGSPGEQRLGVTVSNPIPMELANALAEPDNLSAANTHSSPLTRGHMGLTVSKQLCTDAGGTLEDLVTSTADDCGIVNADVTLHWPVSLTDIAEKGMQ